MELSKPVYERLGRDPNIFHPQLGPTLDHAVTLAENLGRLPILGGNTAEILADYDGTIDRLIADIDMAHDHVHLLFYIVADDATTARVVDALGRAVDRGVVCRLPSPIRWDRVRISDGCCRGCLRRESWRRRRWVSASSAAAPAASICATTARSR
jgi:hypothetical protein